VVAGLLLAACAGGEPPVPHPPVPAAASRPAPPPEPWEVEPEIVPEVLAICPIDESEATSAEVSAAEGGLLTAHEAVQESIGDPQLSIGVGGGAGGMFGGRRSARMLGFQKGDGGGLPPAPGNTAAFADFDENPFHRAADDPLSTFGADVDTASYAFVRRFLRDGERPPRGAVRIEEMVNYFRWTDPPPTGEATFAVRCETAVAPWKPDHRLVRITLRGRTFPEEKRPPANLVFLVDVSGSMKREDKLPLVQSSLLLLAERLGPADRVAIVVYAGNSGLVLPPTAGDRKGDIAEAIGRLQAGGSTNGGEGIDLAYRTAAAHLVKGGSNRVILCTDGDFNVGVTSESELVDLVRERARGGIFLTVLGFGMGNVKDTTLELLADRGNGNYGYVDSTREAEKILVDDLGATLHAIAKDVKIQVEFNPARVAGYRLLGYENRRLAARDFNDDRKDAGEVGAGHGVTAFYEVVPAGSEPPAPPVDALRYRERGAATQAGEASGEILTVKVRWKEPEETASRVLEVPVHDGGAPFAAASEDFRFGAAVAAFGMLLRRSEHAGDASWKGIRAMAADALGADDRGLRTEFLGMVERAAALGW
jgi:Ca-activated chloride channel family protein